LGDRLLGRRAGQLQALLRRLFLVRRADRSAKAQLAVAPLDGKGAGPLAFIDQAHGRLSEQLQQFRARRRQPNFQHSVGHCHDFVDRAQGVLELVLAARSEHPADHSGDLLGGDLAPVRPLRAGQPEDVAQPIVADVPALRQPRFDLAARVEPNQALRAIGDEQRLPGRQRAGRRLHQLGRPADRNDVERAFVLLAASTDSASRSGCERKRQRAAGGEGTHGSAS